MLINKLEEQLKKKNGDYFMKQFFLEANKQQDNSIAYLQNKELTSPTLLKASFSISIVIISFLNCLKTKKNVT